MDEYQYKRLTQICDKILLDQPDNIYRIAIAWLHVPKEHAYLLAKYENMQKGLVIRFFYYLACRLFGLCKSGLFYVFSLNLYKIDKKKDLLIISHLINIEHYHQEADFYFGKVNVDLDTQFLLLNHIGQSVKKIKSKHTPKHNKIILPTSINPFVELFIFVKCFQQFMALLIMGLQCKDSFERAIILRAAVESVSLGTLNALKIRHQIGIVVRKTKPKAILTTYEGHAWERLVYQFAKQYNPSILRLGYHHPPITRLEHASQRPLNTAFNPDYILTTGAIGLAQFKKKAQQLNCQFAILGSPPKTNIIKNTQPICLVLLDAYLEKHTFAYILDCARIHPEIIFLFRVHPLIAKRKIFDISKSPDRLPPNVKISSNPIEEDIACAKWAIYTGTSAIIQAGMAGVIPIYHKIPNQLHVDVFHELSDKVPQAMSCEDFSQIVKAQPNISAIVAYCQRFYSEMDYSIVKEIIENGKN